MSAYFDSGFCVRQPSWHGHELLLDDYPTDWEDARKKAGLEWEPQLQPVYSMLTVEPGMEPGALDAAKVDGTRYVPPEFDGDELVNPAAFFVPEKNAQRVVRDDTGVTLGIVTDSFSLIEHSVMGEILESVLGIENVKFETAGSVKGGAQVWALAYLDEPLQIANDDTETYPFVVLLNSHDGSGACKLINTSIRVVCWNTYQAATMQGERTGRQFTFRHSGDILGRIEEAKKAIGGVREDAAEWTALATELFGMKVDEATFNHFLADFIPEPPAEVISPRVRANIDKARGIFRSLYLDSVTTEGHRGTALGVVDASVEYLDHVRGYRSQDTYLGRTLLRPEPLKAKAVALVREHCAR